MKVGDQVEIYLNPLSSVNWEGTAILVSDMDIKHDRGKGQVLEYWYVHFIQDPPKTKYERWVKSVDGKGVK